RALAVIARLAAERALIYPAVRRAVERHAEVLELVNGFVGLAAHEFDRVLVAQVVRALDGIEHVPVPVVVAVVSERRGDAALRGYCVRARGKNLRQHRDLQIGFSEMERRAQTGPAGADDYRIKLSFRNRHLFICSTKSAPTSPRTRSARRSPRRTAQAARRRA